MIRVNDTKTCCKCKQQKHLDDFYVARSRSDGRASVCKTCHNRSDLHRYKAFRELIDAARSVPCADCNKRYIVDAMEFDHVRGKKVCAVTAMSGYSTERVLKEISKCDIVCSNCHRLRTVSRNRRNPESPAGKRYQWFLDLMCEITSDGCVDCKQRLPYPCLDFDHLPGHKKEYNVSQMMWYSQARILKEVSKCEVVCSNCHRVRTKTRREAA